MSKKRPFHLMLISILFLSTAAKSFEKAGEDTQDLAPLEELLSSSSFLSGPLPSVHSSLSSFSPASSPSVSRSKTVLPELTLNTEKEPIDQKNLPISFRLLIDLHDYSEEYLHNPAEPATYLKNPRFGTLKNEVGAELVKWRAQVLAFWEEYKHAQEKLRAKLERYNRKKQNIKSPPVERQNLGSSWMGWSSVLPASEQGGPNATEKAMLSQEAIIKDAEKDYDLATVGFDRIQDKAKKLHPALSLIAIEAQLVYGPYLKLSQAYYRKPLTDFRPEERVRAFTLNPLDFKIAFNTLPAKIKALEEENEMLEFVRFTYQRMVIARVTGNTKEAWKAYWYCNSAGGAYEEVQKTLKNKYPFIPLKKLERDETTERGAILACLNRDKLGKALTDHYLSKIRKFQEDTFPYPRMDKQILSSEDPKALQQDIDIRAQEEVLNRKYTSLLRDLGEKNSPTNPILPLSFAEIYTGSDKTTEIEGSSPTPFSQVKERYWVSVSEDGQGNNLPRDQRGVAPFTPKGFKGAVKMAEEFRPYPLMQFHRKLWITVLQELHARQKPVMIGYGENLQPADETIKVYDSLQVREYDKLYGIYKELLVKRRALIQQLLTDPKWGLHRAFKFVEDAKLEKPKLVFQLPSSSEIDLSNLQLEDDSLKAKRPTPHGRKNFLYYYTVANLSHNNLVNPTRFRHYFTHLNLRKNQLIGLRFLETSLPTIIELDVSDNKLADLSALGKEKMVSLNRLNLSNNILQGIEALSIFTNLLILDVSGNKLGAIASLRQLTALETLKANNCSLSGNWEHILPKLLARLKILEVNANQNIQWIPYDQNGKYGEFEVGSNNIGFNQAFPALQVLEAGRRLEVRKRSGQEDRPICLHDLINKAPSYMTS